MSLPISVIVVGGGLVGLRMIRGVMLKTALKRLSKGEGDQLVLPHAEFEMAGRMDQLRTVEPSLRTAFTFAPILVRRDAPGKLPVLELTTGIRRSRKLLCLRPKGPNLSIQAVVSPSELVNFITVAALVSAVAFLAGASWPLWVGLAILLAVDLFLRVRSPERSVRDGLTRLLSAKT